MIGFRIFSKYCEALEWKKSIHTMPLMNLSFFFGLQNDKTRSQSRSTKLVTVNKPLYLVELILYAKKYTSDAPGPAKQTARTTLLQWTMTQFNRTNALMWKVYHLYAFSVRKLFEVLPSKMSKTTLTLMLRVLNVINMFRK